MRGDAVVSARWLDRVRPFGVATAAASGLLFNGFNSAVGQAVACIVMCAPLALLVLADPPSPRFWLRALPTIALSLAAMLWVTAATIPALDPGGGSIRPYAADMLGVAALSMVGGLAALLCGAVAATGRFQYRAIIDWLIAWCCMSLLVGLAMREIGTEGALSYWDVEREGRFQGMIGNANVTAAVAGATAILALARLLAVLGQVPGGGWPRGRTRGVAILLGMAFVVAVGAGLATASRSGALLTIVALGALVGLVFRKHGRLLRRTGLGLGTAALVGMLLLAQFSSVTLDRMGDAVAALHVREALWSRYLDIALRSPLFGYGLDAFPGVNAHFITDPALAQESWRLNSAHDLPLQVLLNGGVPYLVLLAAAAIWTFRQMLAKRRSGWKTEDIGVILAVSLVASCALFDIVLDVPGTINFTLFLVGLAWSQRALRRKSGSPERRVSQRRINAR